MESRLRGAWSSVQVGSLPTRFRFRGGRQPDVLIEAGHVGLCFKAAVNSG
ncbi:MAG TPA: hypothetical protein VH353_03560 [Caulobacteraceae bacterium]|jgi:hypothetical protein|nr:hypothetical protein [Caulobacteraceae bacterium]